MDNIDSTYDGRLIDFGTDWCFKKNENNEYNDLFEFFNKDKLLFFQQLSIFCDYHQKHKPIFWFFQNIKDYIENEINLNLLFANIDKCQLKTMTKLFLYFNKYIYRRQ